MSGNNKGGGGTGLMFSLAGLKKAAAKPKVQIHDKNEEKKKELVTGIGAGGSLELAEQSAQPSGAGPRVIPKIEDTFKTGRKAPSFLPTAADANALGSAEDKFEAAAPEASREVTYGLNRMGPRDGDANGGDAPSASGAGNGRGGGRGGRGRGGGGGGGGGGMSAQEAMEAERLRRELEELPQVSSVEDYERMPVEEFGLALLRGMGWQDGEGVGRKRQEVKPVEYVRRPDRLGLGAAPAPAAAPDKKYIKPGESRDPKKDLVYVNADGITKHVKTIDDKLVERPKEGAEAGKRMRVVEGRHEGLDCVVVALEPRQEGRSDRATVRLLPSEEEVSVRVQELGEIGGAGASRKDKKRGSDRRDGDGDRDGKRYRGDGGGGSGSGRDRERERERGGGASGRSRGEELEERDDRRDSDRDKDRDRDRDHRRDRGGSGREDRHHHHHRSGSKHGGGSSDDGGDGGRGQEEEEAPWLAPSIRVRVVDKKLGGGKHYLRKGTVVDVHSPTVCDVHLDGVRETLTGVRQRQLETVVPKQEGARVLVLAGKLRGSVARLLKRSAESGMAAIQVTADFSVHKLPLDDVAEYVGHDDD